MKNFKALIFATIFATSQVQSVDLPKMFEDSSRYVSKTSSQFIENLKHDNFTQGTTLISVAALAGGYIYYQQQSSLACLDGHPNGRIMQKSNLMNVTYLDFLDKIEAVDSYAAALEFINQYCIDYYFFTSHSKINRFVALARDLQIKNNKRFDATVDAENMILENFSNQLLTAQANIEKEILNDAINANKRSLNLYSIGKAMEIIANLLSYFNN